MKKIRLVDLLRAGAVTLGLCVVSSQATAAVVCTGTGTVASSCSGVDIGGTLYDVTWQLPTYLNDAGYPDFGPALTVTSSAVANPLVTEINTALNTGLFTSIQYTLADGSTTSTNACSVSCYQIPYRIDATFVSSYEGRFDSISTNQWINNGFQGYVFATQNSRPVAVFTPSAIPVPAALPLFLSGLALVGWVGRRRQQRS